MAFKDLFSFLFQRSTNEERVAQYVIREHDRGRALHDILEDKYVVNRLPSQEQRDRLLDRPEVIHAVGGDKAAAAKPPDGTSSPARSSRLRDPALRSRTEQQRKRPSGKGRFGESGGGWDTSIIGRSARFPFPRWRDSRGTRALERRSAPP